MITIVSVLLILLLLLVNIDSIPNGNFEAAPIVANYAACGGASGYCNGWTFSGDVRIIRKTSTDFQHAANANGGEQFVCIKMLNAYIQQTIQSSPNTLFSVTFDSAFRDCAGSWCGNTPIDVYCNVPGGAPVLASFSTTATWTTTTTAATCKTDASGFATIKFSINSVVGTADRTVYLDNIIVNIGNYQHHIHSSYYNIY